MTSEGTAEADVTVWAWNRRSEQLARGARDWAPARSTVLGTADAVKWVNRWKYRLSRSLNCLTVTPPPPARAPRPADEHHDEQDDRSMLCGRRPTAAATAASGGPAVPHWNLRSPELEGASGPGRASF